MGYTRITTPEPTMIPMSPVPMFAMGPTYHACDMHGTISPKAQRKARKAAKPTGR